MSHTDIDPTDVLVTMGGRMKEAIRDLTDAGAHSTHRWHPQTTASLTSRGLIEPLPEQVQGPSSSYVRLTPLGRQVAELIGGAA